MNKDLKSSFENPIVLVATLIVIFVAGYFVLNTPKNSQQSEIDNLKNELNALKQKEDADAKSATVSKNSNSSLSSIISEWRNRTAYLLCSGTDLSTGKNFTQSATAYISRGEDNIVRAITNRHAVTDSIGGLVKNCTVSLPGTQKDFLITTKDIILSTNQLIDVAAIALGENDPYIQSITSQNKKICFKQNSNKPYLGDQVLVLGYPAIGSPTDITATDGIISGYDYPYYITSAKIDHGNSGGIAILVKDDCYLGIPTGSVVGEIESLGRILDGSVINNAPAAK